jgi:hypothetical protein
VALYRSLISTLTPATRERLKGAQDSKVSDVIQSNRRLLTPEIFMESPVQRKLTATLMADIKGYSRLTGADEEATLRQLRSARRLLVDSSRNSEVIWSMHQEMACWRTLAVWVDAVRGAVEVQKDLGQRNAEPSR